MLGNILGLVIGFLPDIIKGIETLFSKKPKSGSAKLNAVLNLVENALSLAQVVDPKDIGDAERDLFTEVTNAIVKYNNAKGIFITTK